MATIKSKMLCCKGVDERYLGCGIGWEVSGVGWIVVWKRSGVGWDTQLDTSNTDPNSKSTPISNLKYDGVEGVDAG